MKPVDPTLETLALNPCGDDPTANVGVRMTVFGVVAYALLNVTVVSQVVGEPVPAVTVNEPVESVAPVVTAAVGLVPQFMGVPIVGAVVCEDSRCPLEMLSVANVVVVPAMVMIKFDVSAVNSAEPLLFCKISKAATESVWGSTITDPPVPVPVAKPPCSSRLPPLLVPTAAPPA